MDTAITFVKGNLNYIAAVIGAMVYVYMQHKDKPQLRRLGIVGASGGLGVGAGPELATRSGFPEIITGVLLIVLSFTILDVLLAVTSDREAVASIIKEKLGAKKKDE